jgi:hypothetical protein
VKVPEGEAIPFTVTPVPLVVQLNVVELLNGIVIVNPGVIVRVGGVGCSTGLPGLEQLISNIKKAILIKHNPCKQNLSSILFT